MQVHKGKQENTRNLHTKPWQLPIKRCANARNIVWGSPSLKSTQLAPVGSHRRTAWPKKSIFPKHICLGSSMWSSPSSAGNFSLTPPSPGTAWRTQRRPGEAGRLYCSSDQTIGHDSEHLYNDDQGTDSVEARWLQTHTEPPDSKIPQGWWHSSSQTNRLYHLDQLTHGLCSSSGASSTKTCLCCWSRGQFGWLNT